MCSNLHTTYLYNLLVKDDQVQTLKIGFGLSSQLNYF